jgi:DHA2 family multidrug resistance protein
MWRLPLKSDNNVAMGASKDLQEQNSMIEYGSRRVIITITVVVCALLEIIDSTIVNVATTTLAGNLGATISEISWVIAAYAIANVIVVPMSGWLSGQFGRKAYFAGSIILFTFSSLMCGQSTSIWMLVFWRFIQGVGGGALLAISQSILVEIYPREKMGMANAMFGMGIIVGPTLGPVLGGYLIDNHDWPVIFYVNVPIGIIATILTLKYIRNNPYEKRPSGNIDWMGIFLLIAGIGSLQFVLEKGEQEDWFESKAISIAAMVAIAGIIAFIWHERRATHPIVDLKVLRKGNVAIGTFLSFILGSILFGTIFVIPIYVQRFLGFTATQTGELFTPGAFLTGMCMPFIGRALQKGTPPKILIACGFFLTALFVFWCSLIITSHTSPEDFFWPLMVRGLGMGLLFVPLTNLTLSGLMGRDIAQASGISGMVRQIGGSISVAMVGIITERSTSQHRNDLLSNVNAYNPLLDERTVMMAKSMEKFSSDAERNASMSLHAVEHSIFTEASVLTYIDIFQYSTVFILIIIPVLFWAKNLKGDIPPGSAH